MIRLREIEIKNFRSIEKIRLEIKNIASKYCAIFLGVNESGKSNILQAIALLNKKTDVHYDIDCNKKAKKNEESILITCSFDILDDNLYRNKFKESNINEELVDKIKIKKIERKVEISKDEGRKDYIYIWLNKGSFFSNYLMNKDTNIIEKVSDVYHGKEKLTQDNLSQLISEAYQFLDKDMLEAYIESKFFNLFDSKCPEIIFWKSSKKYLIHEPVDLNKFKKDLNISVPLRNIFKIANVEDIEKRIDLIANNIEERIELQETLSNDTTIYVNSKWPEHKINIKVVIEESLFCSVMVEDKDNLIPKYKMAQRSDGFKQFISILLNLSAENKTGLLKNKIVILDEPEVHLHPSGTRYLRDELLKVAENNIVFIASHSVYMVDRCNLNRHYKVYKESAETLVFPIDKANPYQEEVIYEALGTSILETIEPNMIIFEGKTDKDIFDAFTKKFNGDIKPINIGTISADGAQNIIKYTKFFNNKLVAGFVVVDSDKEGEAIKATILKEPGYNKKNVFAINDIRDTKMKATLEDLIPEGIVSKCIKDRYGLKILFNNAGNKEPIIAQAKSKLKDEHKIGPKDKLEELKGDIVKDILKDLGKLKKVDAKNKYKKYYDFACSLHEKLKSK